MLREPRRLIASIIAIAVGVAFAAATFFLSASLEKSINSQIAGEAAGASLVVSSSNQNMVPPALITKLAQQPEVARVHATASSIFEEKTSRGSQYLILRELPDPGSATKVSAGRMPAAKGEVAFTEDYAKARKLAVGSTLEIYAQDRSQTVTLTVVGLIKPGDEYGDPSGTFAVATQDDLLRPSSFGPTGYSTLMSFGGDPTALKTSVQAMSEVTSNALTVQTGTEYLDEQKKSIKDTLSVITNFLLGFAAVALFVGALVIANTFSILVAQRSGSSPCCAASARRGARCSVRSSARRCSWESSVAPWACSAAASSPSSSFRSPKRRTSASTTSPSRPRRSSSRWASRSPSRCSRRSVPRSARPEWHHWRRSSLSSSPSPAAGPACRY
jgi:putative ABC transport system permease protein